VSSGKYSGTYTPPVKAIHKYNKPLTKQSSTLPSSWDWRPKCTPIANQEQCGDCWAFAAVGVVEADISIIDSVTRDISEEWLSNCYTGNGCSGCNGGDDPLDAFLQPQGAVYESEDPWTSSEANGTTGSCGGPYQFHEFITSHSFVPGCMDTTVAPADSIKAYMYKYGPIFSYVDASNSGWDNYYGGIWVETGSSNTDHAIVLVGWCDTTVADNSGGYWILRNSWGTGWGVNGTGYMYITYGSDFTGQGANYVVYKTNKLPPVADFTVSATTSCTGTVQFTDLSHYSPTSWLWNFGDGGTSNIENPSHIYTASGTYSVTLTSYNSYGDSSITKSNFITVSLPPPPIVTNGSTVLGGSVTLHASGSDTLNWFNAVSGGTIVNTGASYTISPLNANDTLYVENDVITPLVSSVGMTDSTTNGNNYSGTRRRGLVFDAYVPLTIDTVTVYESTAGSRTIFLKNNTGAVIDSLVITTVTGKQKIPLNLNVPVGTGYTLGAAGASYFWREMSGAAYPYSLAGAISITGNSAGTSGYYYFYNWIISYSTICSSARIPVIATVANGINEISKGSFAISPNPNTGSFYIKLNDLNIQNATISIVNMLGQTVFEKNVVNNNAPIHIEAENIQQGMYYIKIQSEKSTFTKKVLIAN
jgi:PKD repeat protein